MTEPYSTFVGKRKQFYALIGYLSLSGNAITTCKSNDKVKVLTVRGTAFEAAKTSGNGVASENGTYHFLFFFSKQ